MLVRLHQQRFIIVVNDEARLGFGGLFYVFALAVIHGHLAARTPVRIVSADFRGEQEDFFGDLFPLRRDDDVRGMVFLRVEPNIGRGTAFQQPVVLQVVSPAEDAEAHIFVFAEGDDGLLFLCAYPFPLRLYEPQRNELRLRLFEVVLRLRRGEGGKDALRVGNFFLLRFPAGQECVSASDTP